jgi:hypothetical protein
MRVNKEQQELLDEVYKKYQSQTMFRTDDLVSLEELDGMCLGTGEIKKVYRQYAPKEFINKCKTDTEFSQRWGLKIEEQTILEQVDQNNPMLKGSTALYPRKLITITYNDKTIESYE